MGQQLECRKCHEGFPPQEFYFRGGKPDTTWCKRCYREWHLSRYEPKSEIPETQTCQNCGVEIVTRQRRVVKYCSVYCRNQGRIKREREELLARLADRTCGYCGELIPTTVHHSAEYCDSKCAQRARRDRQAPGHRSRYNMKRQYGLTPEERDALIVRQGGGCAICGTGEPGTKGWAIDHDHSCCPGNKTCGQCLRGILCQRCNLAIGLLNDDPSRLRAAARYVSRRVTI